MLKKQEYLDGWVEFICPTHGILGVAPASTEMFCGGKGYPIGTRCNKLAIKSYGKFSKRKVEKQYEPLGVQSLFRYSSA